MKKSECFDVPRLILHTVLFFAINIFNLPTHYTFFSVNKFWFEFKNTEDSIIVLSMVLVLSILYAISLQRLQLFNYYIYPFLVILILADPLIKCTLLNLSHIVLLSIMIIICIYLIEGKLFWIKSLLVATYIIFSVCINLEATFTHIPFLMVFYSFSWMKKICNSNNKILSKKESKCKNKDDSINPKNQSQFSLHCYYLTGAVVLVLVILSFIINREIANKFIINQSDIKIFNFSQFFYGYRVVIAMIPYVGIFCTFVIKFYKEMLKANNFNIKSVVKELTLLISILSSYIMIFIGFLVYKYDSAITVFNILNLMVVVLFCDYEPMISRIIIRDLFKKAYKFKYLLIILFVIWFCFIQSEFAYVQNSLIDDILAVVGNKL